jgi:hypothetical protein
MGQASSWWRKLGMTFAALVLTLLTFAPALDGLLCRDEDSLSAVVATLTPTADAGADLATHEERGAPTPDDKGVCLHGHCHHSTPCVGAADAGAEMPVRLAAADHVLEPGRPPTSEPIFGLKRPPRA